MFLLLGVAATLALATQHAHLGEWAGRCVGFFRAAGPLPFFSAMALLPLVGFPLSPFTVIAGPVFGPTMGVGAVIACVIAAVAVNVTLSYGLAAHALRPLVARLARWLGYTLPELPAGTAWEITLLVRIIPGLPFFLQSYVLGLARVPFGIYLLISILVPALYLGGVILAGDAMMRGDWRMLTLAGVLCGAAGVAIHRLRKRLTARSRGA